MASLFDTPLDESVEVLKRVLPLMSAQKVPTIPQNYAIWYEYVSNANEELRAELDALLLQGESFTPSTCRSIYERHYQTALRNEVDGIQGAVRGALESALGEIAHLGDDIEHYSEVLEKSEQSLSGDPTSEDLSNLVVELVKETAHTKARSQEVESSLNHMAEELTELRTQIDRLNRDSRTDALTGIANRRAFDEALEQMTKEADEDNPVCLILADIDHFKAFNDTHGHRVGDLVLGFVAREIEQCVKGRDLAARYGGEEFAVLLPATSLRNAVMLAENIRMIIEAQQVQDEDGTELEKVTISMGVSQFIMGETMGEFVERADECLYLSKERGRNKVSSEKDLPHH